MLRDYQIRDVAFAITNRRSLNLSDPGTGKTPSACVYTYWCWHDRQIRSVWVQPKSLLVKNWDELLRFTNFKPEDVIIVDGPPAKRQKAYEADAKVWLMGSDMFGREWPILLEHHPDIGNVVADEIHMYWASANSARTKGWFRAMRKIDRFLGMTGTLIDGRYSSAYPAIHVIEPRYYGSEANFLAWHAELDFFGNITGWKNPERLQKIFAKHAVRHSFKEVYGPEAKVVIPEIVDLSPGQAKIYGELHAKAMIELEDSYIDAGLPGVFALRARQVLSHPETFECKDTPGKDEAMEVHCANPGSLAVFAVFNPEQERLATLAEKSGRRVAVLNGDIPTPERTKIDKAFRAGELDTVVCSPKVAAVGFNWHHLQRMVFSSCDYQDSSFFQAYRRGIRGKRETPLLIYVQKYRDTIDDRIWEIIERKSREANAVDPSREIYSLTG